MENKTNILAIVSIIALVAALAILALSKYDADDKNTISVSGNSQIMVSPDQAAIYANVNTEANTSKEAQSKNSETSDRVIAALKQAGVKQEDIETTNYYLSKKTVWNPLTQRPEDQGYILSHTMKITTRNLDTVGNLVDTAVNSGANGIERISFELQNETALNAKNQALIKASDDAREKAQSLADSLGLKLGKVASVQESNYRLVPFEYAPSDLAKTESTQIMPQKVDVTSSVTVVYSID